MNTLGLIKDKNTQNYNAVKPSIDSKQVKGVRDEITKSIQKSINLPASLRLTNEHRAVTKLLF